MKKIVCILLAVMFIASLAACGEKTVSTGTTSTEPAQKTETDKETTEKETTAAKSADTNYVDLTEMSSTMVYSEVQNMMMKPADYVGKTVKMHGAFSVTEVDNKRYFACIIKDATACCAQGIEFRREGDYSYPGDYPKEGEEITVIGTFNTYKEGEQLYCELQEADVQF